MAYQTGVPTSQENFFDLLTTFAAANGFTLDEHSAPSSRSAISHAASGLYVQWRWDGTQGVAAYQSTGFSLGTAPGSQAGDSGNGQASGTVTTERRWEAIGAGPYTSYHFFANNNSQGFPYLHYVLEYAPGEFRHGSVGRLEIFGDNWGGATAEKGAYCAHAHWSGTVGPTSTVHAFLFDSLGAQDTEATTWRCNNAGGELPSHSTTQKWFVHTDDITIGNDPAGNVRERSGCGIREGFLANAMDGYPANPNSGFVPFVPVFIYYRFFAPTVRFAKLGEVPDIRFLNGKNLEPAEELVLGSDTWKTFPWARKATSGHHSGNAFIAYKKVV